MANVMTQSTACGDLTVGAGVSTITTTTSADMIGGGTGSNYITTIDGLSLIDNCCSGTAIGITTATAGSCVTLGYNYNSNYGVGLPDKSVIQGKDGDILMDLNNMKFKVYCNIKGWVEYVMEDFSTKDRKIELNGSKETSIAEVISERRNRKVLIEKMPKKKELYGGIWLDAVGTANYTLFGDYNNIITGGHINTAIGYTTLGYAGHAEGQSTATYNTVSFNGNTEVNGNLTVNGDIKVNGDFKVTGINYSA